MTSQNYNSSVNTFQNAWEGIQALTFSIPEEIFNVLDVLTNFVGYIMPLRLYQPIIGLILAYWLLLIVKNTSSFFARIFMFFTGK